MGEKEFELIANKIADVLDHIDDTALHAQIKDEMKALAQNFIIYDKAIY
ncbi:MAG TPA: serine hydroxymethyltransferase, partial [Epsilonproteobacteria bacterium]|nr:serine hydroxymethyltransferase [Campylobacterota bacterium]